ncbi:MAG TPA: hypothetical protein VK997_02005 [Deferrisomatales bacterium]|nr:hypothetical protein [Deferrisomatales bacterium]
MRPTGTRSDAGSSDRDEAGGADTAARGRATDAALRLRHYTIFLSLGVPLMVAFGIHHLARGNASLSGAIFLSAVALLAGRGLIARAHSPMLVYRVNAALFGTLLLYLCAVGGEAGSKSLWLYVFPLIASFLLGATEGLAWSSVVLLGTLGIFAGGFGLFEAHPYPGEFRIRFGITYSIVMIVSCWFELLRSEYRIGMQNQHEQLQLEKELLEEEIAARERLETEKDRTLGELRTALDRVKTLSGLIPICANCKNIRDDQGYWHRVEAYVKQHSTAEFTHGICPDCREKLYPEFSHRKG